MTRSELDERIKGIPALVNPSTPSLKRLKARLEGTASPRPAKPARAAAERQRTQEPAAAEPESIPCTAEPRHIKLRLTKPHKLIQHTLDLDAKEREPGYYHARNPDDKVDARSSPARRRVALAVLDSLFKRAEVRGWGVYAGSDHRGGGTGTFITSDRGYDRVAVKVFEKQKRIPHQPTERELKEQELHSWRRIPKWDEVWTGEIFLEPGGLVDLSSWTAFERFLDNALHLIEDQLAQKRVDRQEREEAARRDQEQRAREEAERKRIEAVDAAASALQRYRRWVAYIDEVRRVGSVPPAQRREGQSLEEWLAWAEELARRMHPLA